MTEDEFDDVMDIDLEIPGVKATVGELQEMVEELILAVEQARSVPLSGSVMLDRGEFSDMLKRMRAEIPDELRTARWMVREREAFVAKTNERAKEVIERAKAKAAEMVSESRIMAEAVEEANILVRNAEAEAMRTRLQAEDMAEETYEQLDELLSSLLERVRGRRSELHEAREAAPEVPISE